MKSYPLLFLLKTPIHYIIQIVYHCISDHVNKQHYWYCYPATEFQYRSDIT